MKNALLLFFFLIAAGIASAQINFQVQVVDASQVPQEVLSAQESNFSGLAIDRWEKQTGTGKEKTKVRYVAVFKENNQRVRARYHANGAGISATTYYGGKQLPQAIQEAAAASYAGYTLMSGEKIQSLKDSKNVFRIRLRKGAQKLVVYVDETGREISKDKVPAEIKEDEATE